VERGCRTSGTFSILTELLSARRPSSDKLKGFNKEIRVHYYFFCAISNRQMSNFSESNLEFEITNDIVLFMIHSGL
jgi:hypothetical protein